MSIEHDIKEISKTLKSIEQLLTASATPEQLETIKEASDRQFRFQDHQASLRGEMTCSRV